MDSLSRWVLTENDTLFFWVRTIKQPQYGFQFFSVRIGDDHGNYYKYTASPSLLSTANLVWKQYKLPLSGNAQFSRSSTGTMSLDNVNYVEFHADTWDYGFTLWVDGVQFNPCTPFVGISQAESNLKDFLEVFPNPFRDNTTIRITFSHATPAKLELFDLRGTHLATLLDKTLSAGTHTIPYPVSRIQHPVSIIHHPVSIIHHPSSSNPHPASRVLLLKLTTPTTTLTRKLILWQ
jgi:hypothetical protein